MQHDFSLDNQPGAAFRGDLNEALQALVGLNSGDTAPSVTYPYMWWMDTANSLLKQRNAGNTAWITVAAITVDGWSPYYQGQEFVDYISGNLTWQAKALGEPFALRDDLPGVATPPTDSGAFRFIKLTAGEAGFGLYNEGILINETVSGTAPLITATAEINLPDSPLHGQVINLINTESRYVKPGTAAGALADDQMQQITGSVETMGYTAGTTPAANTGAVSYELSGGVSYSERYSSIGSTASSYKIEVDSANSPDARTGDHTDVKHQQATYYMRIL